jgi:hypothetical protein
MEAATTPRRNVLMQSTSSGMSMARRRLSRGILI